MGKCIVSVAGVTVSIVAFQAVDPGSIPGRRNFFNFDRYLVGCLSYFSALLAFSIFVW